MDTIGNIERTISRPAENSGFPRLRETSNAILRLIGYSKNRDGLYVVSGENKYRKTHPNALTS